MKLRRIEIQSVRRLKGPIVIEQLNDGINLFTGPNGSGKTSLVSAIRAAFFERYKSTAVALRPHDEPSASPRVSIDFDIAGTPHQLTKQFFTGKRCALRIGPNTYDGDDAEDRLASLLGYSYAGRGASKAEHWGIPGLLWVEQGTGQELSESVGHARERLQSALQEMVGTISSTAGDSVIESLKDQRHALVSEANNNPRGDYALAKRELDQLTPEILDLDAKLSTYQADVDRLSRDDNELRHLEITRPWEALEAQANAARADAERAATLQRELDEHLRSEQAADNLLEMIHSQARAREATQSALPVAQSRFDQLSEDHARIDKAHQAASAAYSAASDQLTAAKQTLVRAQVSAKRTRLDRDIQDAQAHLARLQAQHSSALDLVSKLSDARRAAAAAALPSGAIDSIRRLTGEIRDLDLQLDVVGTKISYEIDSGANATLDGQPLSGAGARTLQRESIFQAAGIRLHITPGSAGLGDLRADRDAKQVELNQLLASIGLSSTADAEHRAASHNQSLQDEATLNLQLSHVAPDGTDALAQDVAAAHGKVQALLAELANQPADDGQPAIALADAIADEALAADAKDLRRDELASAANQLSQVATAKEAAAAELRRLQEQIESPEWQATSRNLAENLARAHDSKRTAKALAISIQDKLSTLDPGQLEQDVRRLTASAKEARDAHARLSRTVLELRTKVEMLGGQGIEERLADLRVRRDKLANRVAEFARQVQVIDHLLGHLEARRDTLRQQLIAPLQVRIDHYLRLLMPGLQLQLRDDLAPDQLVNAADARSRGDFDTQSFGTREQLSLICRLAYADLLKESGAPTLIILDDALVHTDHDRLAAMKRVLFDASERHQILMMTCHPDRWRDLGASPTSMLDLVGASA